MDARAELTALIAQELAQPVAPAVRTMADAVRARHPNAALAVLFYGSCLRRPESLLADSLLDFYLLVDDYKTAYAGAMTALANRILPPNVFYLEAQHEGATLRCKYAVISLAQFQEGTSRTTDNVSLWARFSQQSRLVWSRNPQVLQAVAGACTEATLTMLASVLPLVDRSAAADAIWQRAFEETYRAEVRSEGRDRATELVNADAERYRRVHALVRGIIGEEGQADAAAFTAAWRRRRRISKLLNFARLVKATFTFDGALDYVLWKVKRHSGVVLPVTDWQRRHPLLSAPVLAWKLYRRGAFR
ncbi:hypothetical protein [Dongia deserti]|uniref:hypothetical protein n=1 Tax=Dongia deserti TaxID=2268030 RepID=UPI000E657E92|nr:hypothetical protein [Dongia deserti]